jgi:hypothetical protein
MPPVTPEAELRRASRDRGSFGAGPFYGPEDFTLYDRCITRGIVGGVLPVPYGNGNRILQTHEYFVITYEMIHDTRIEGNGAIKYILSAERAEDKALEEDLKKGIVRPRKDPQNDISRDPFE